MISVVSIRRASGEREFFSVFIVVLSRVNVIIHHYLFFYDSSTQNYCIAKTKYTTNGLYFIHKILYLLLMFRLLFLLTLIAFSCSALPPQNPIIGIYTLENPYSEFGNASYSPTSYVRFVEMSGAQVVPIFAFSETS